MTDRAVVGFKLNARSSTCVNVICRCFFIVVGYFMECE
jgi:hypothetical protein